MRAGPGRYILRKHTVARTGGRQRHRGIKEAFSFFIAVPGQSQALDVNDEAEDTQLTMEIGHRRDTVF